MEKLILVVDKDGNDRSIRPSIEERQVSRITVTYNPPVTRRTVQVVLRGLEGALAGATVAMDLEDEDVFLTRMAQKGVPADARSWRIATEKEAADYASKREAENERLQSEARLTARRALDDDRLTEA
jgi:hypothetical protein